MKHHLHYKDIISQLYISLQIAISLQGALHAANGELTAITSEKDILVKHLDKCQVRLSFNEAYQIS